jgi:hypothetical protein
LVLLDFFYLQPPILKIMRQVGTREEVYSGKAKETSGGLRKSDLKKNKEGVIVSRKKSEQAKRLKKFQYKKGESPSSRSRSRSRSPGKKGKKGKSRSRSRSSSGSR